jgi:DNA-directed RNA polymerase subunit RPC12/RpoP
MLEWFRKLFARRGVVGCPSCGSQATFVKSWVVRPRGIKGIVLKQYSCPKCGKKFRLGEKKS